MHRKKRVLFLSEASYLSTGYATYSREVLKRLHESGKYEVAELSIYGGVEDPRRAAIPWKNYPNMPSTDEERKHYGANVIHQFGSWRFERACLDFKPDVVLTIRDYWMDYFVKNSPFRRIFKWCWMPTVDGSPQNPEWIATFADCDGVLTYSKFAYNLLQNSCGNTIKLRGVASPAASQEFRIKDRKQCKASLGINPEHQIIGTVMRNQRRKLYPDLFKAFGKLVKGGDTNTYLYCHTGYPDNGWDFSQLLIDEEITSRVYFTYKCKCGLFGAYKFSDVVQQCPKCKNFSLATTNVNDGLTTEDLSTVYNSFDLYCQANNSEGFGIPVVEAAACGVPVCCTNYSATEDFVETLGAIPIKYSALYNELETGVNRAVIDTDHLCSIFKDFFNKPQELRYTQGYKTRQNFQKNYDWDAVANTWAEFIDESDYSDWTINPVLRPNHNKLPSVRNNKELVHWAFLVSSVDDRMINSYEYQSLLKDLNFGMMKKGTSGYLVPESSIFDAENYHSISAEHVLNIVNNRINMNNFWENARIGNVQLPKEAWLV